MFFHCAVVNVLFIGMYFGSCAPFIFFPSADKPNSIRLQPLLLNQCANLPEAGQSVFSEFIEKYKCYVDKTEYLYKMVQETQAFWFLSRPRGFGKTLLISTMESFFTGEEQLFRGTKIYSHYVNSWPKHPVIRLDFSKGISTDSFSKFYGDMIKKLRRVAESHNISLTASTVTASLRRLVNGMKYKYNKEVVILIDEYDSPYTRSFAVNKEVAAQILGTLESFSDSLKARVENTRFCFIICTTRIVLSNFAGVARDLTILPEYSAIVGFTEKEVIQYFGGFIEKVAVEKKRSTENVLNEMAMWHGGFRFTRKNESLFSPISVIGYLRSGGDVQCYSYSGESQFLVERLKAFKWDALELFVSTSVVGESDEEQEIFDTFGPLTERIIFYDPTHPAHPVPLEPLLFRSGYLSISDYNNVTDRLALRFPNLEMKQNYAWRLYYSFTGEGPTSMEKRVNSLVQDLDVSRWESFISGLDAFHSGMDSFHCSIPSYLNVYRRKGREAWFQFTMYLAFHFSTYKNTSKLLMEDATNKSRSAITLPLDNKMYIFEPKTMENPEHPVYECKVKYLQKHFFGTMEEVVCIGLKFNENGNVGSWGVATFSQGKLTGESGKTSLTNPLSLEEKKKIESKLTDFKKEYSNFTLPSDQIIKFLTEIGPSTENELKFAKYFTTDIRSLCIFLGSIKNELQSNVKSIINGFQNRNDPR